MQRNKRKEIATLHESRQGRSLNNNELTEKGQKVASLEAATQRQQKLKEEKGSGRAAA